MFSSALLWYMQDTLDRLNNNIDMLQDNSIAILISVSFVRFSFAALVFICENLFRQSRSLERVTRRNKTENVATVGRLVIIARALLSLQCLLFSQPFLEKPLKSVKGAG
ncbi:hypothetical protein BsWGS_03777 [Bradybaena similaris]